MNLIYQNVLMILIAGVIYSLLILKHCSCHIRNILFQQYCTNFYGSQLLPFCDVKIQELYISWRVAVRRVWHVPWRTHYNMLAHIAGVMDSLVSNLLKWHLCLKSALCILSVIWASMDHTPLVVLILNI